MSQLFCTCGHRLSNVGYPNPEVGELVQWRDLERFARLPLSLHAFPRLGTDDERYSWVAAALGHDEATVREWAPGASELPRLIVQELALAPNEATTRPEAWCCSGCGRLFLERDGGTTTYRPDDDPTARLSYPSWPEGLELRSLDPVIARQHLADVSCACGVERTLTAGDARHIAWLSPADEKFAFELALADLLERWLAGSEPQRASIVGPAAAGLSVPDLLAGMALAFAVRCWRATWPCTCSRLHVQRWAGSREYVSYVSDA